jgi:hypothetical protein
MGDIGSGARSRRENYSRDLVSGFCWRDACNARQHIGAVKKISR